MLTTIITIAITLFILGAIFAVANFFIEKIPASNALYQWGKILLYLVLAIFIIGVLIGLLPAKF